MNNETIEQLKEEFQELMDKILDSSELAKCLEKYGIADDVLEIPVVLNLDNIKFNNDIDIEKLQSKVNVVSNQENKLEILRFSACVDYKGMTIRKPLP